MGESGKLYFEIPQNIENAPLAALVLSVPPNKYSYMGGVLRAPASLIAAGDALGSTGYEFKYPNTFKSPDIVGDWIKNERSRCEPNLVELIGQHKLPGFLEFCEAGISGEPLSLADGQQMAMHFINRGYRGSLYFIKGSWRGESCHTAAACRIRMNPWVGTPFEHPETEEQPARVLLEWDNQRGGKKEHVSLSENLCRHLGFKEYVPERRNMVA